MWALGQSGGSGFGIELFGFSTIVYVLEDSAVCCGCAVAVAPPGPPGSNVVRLYPEGRRFTTDGFGSNVVRLRLVVAVVFFLSMISVAANS